MGSCSRASAAESEAAHRQQSRSSPWIVSLEPSNELMQRLGPSTLGQQDWPKSWPEQPLKRKTPRKYGALAYSGTGTRTVGSVMPQSLYKSQILLCSISVAYRAP